MSTLFYVVCIVAIVMTADTIQKLHKARHDKKQTDERSDDELAQLQRLEERIQVLDHQSHNLLGVFCLVEWRRT